AAAARDHLDVFFAPAYTAGLLHRTPIVVAIHDVSFAAHPEWFRVREGVRKRWLARQSALKARAVVTISQFSRSEVIERFHLPQERVHVIPPGITLPLSATEAISSQRPVPIADGARVLYVGSIFNRRHLPDLIRAFAPIARAHSRALLDLV